jgi:hypothetical protein
MRLETPRNRSKLSKRLKGFYITPDSKIVFMSAVPLQWERHIQIRSVVTRADDQVFPALRLVAGTSFGGSRELLWAARFDRQRACQGSQQ